MKKKKFKFDPDRVKEDLEYIFMRNELERAAKEMEFNDKSLPQSKCKFCEDSGLDNSTKKCTCQKHKNN